MFKTFFISELKYSLKQPMVYIFLGLMTLLTFGATASDNITIGGAIGNVYKNAPHIISIYTSIMTIFGLLIATAFFNNAALRDHNNNFHEILFSTPLNKSGYFFGRFFGALFLSSIPMLGIFLGVVLGTVSAQAFGWIDSERFGHFYIETFVNNYLLFILPNMFFAGTIIFSMAHKWKSTTISFVGTLIIIIAYITSGTLMSDIDNETLGALTDTFGIRAYTLYSKYFTPAEKNILSPSLSGILLYNRLVWIATGSLILMVSYFGFSFHEKNQKVKAIKDKDNTQNNKLPLPSTTAVFSSQTEWIQFISFFKINFLSIAKSVTFKILFLFSAVVLISNLIGGFEYFGLQSYPLTYKLIDTISNTSSIFVIIVLVFFSGELIWRDRDNKINEVIDATPHTSFISLAAKSLSLISITVVLHAFFVLCGIIYQLAHGFTRIELDVYILDFVYSTLISYIVWSGVMIMIQVLLNNKYIGYFISIVVVFVWSIMLSVFDIHSNMLFIGNRPGMIYSDMNAFGPSLSGVLWFNLYWVLFSALCLLLAGALWQRGTTSALKTRIAKAKKQMTKKYNRLVLTTLTIWIFTATFIYYNTQILNPYETSDTQEQLSVDYETTYKKYENIALPKIHDVKYNIDIYPHQRKVMVNAHMTLVNETEQAIDSIHYNIDRDWQPEIIIPQATLVLDDNTLDYQIYKLAQTLQPGDSINIEINTKYISKGFKNNMGNTRIVDNGTFLNNLEILPSMGYQADNELSDKNTRKKYGLQAKDKMPKLEDPCGTHCMRNYLSNGTADFIKVETIISTAADQIAIAPGSKINAWKENNRNYYHYKLDHPSQNFYAFMSADYQVKTRKWQDVDIEVYYDAKHYHNVDMMIDAVERSLTYYSQHFGPYMHKQCRIIEFPRYASFAQAFPGTMPYSESMGFVTNLEDKNENNVVDAVIAHEMAHQWWAHQLIGAKMQGATMLSESFAEYSSLMTMKSIAKTPMKMRKFLKYNHNRYLRGRSVETAKELPLYKVEKQGYIHYGKGSIILYALQDYIGEDKVNRAMRNFLEAYKYQKPPYPTSLDFIRYLEAEVPDSLSYLINDWIKQICLYDNRLKEAYYSKMDNGKYQISMHIESKKLLADTIGNETSMPLNDWVDIGAFADTDEKRLLFEKRVKIDRPKMTFTFEMDTIPAKLAIDPRHLLIDRIYSDNIKTAKEK